MRDVVSSIRAQFIHQPLHPDEAAGPVQVTPAPDTDSQQLVRRWSVKWAPTLCIHIPIVTDLYGVDTGLLSSPPQQAPVAGRRAARSSRFGRQPPPSSRRCVLTSLHFFTAWPLCCLPLQPLAVCNSHTHCGCPTPASGQMNIALTFYEGLFFTSCYD